jgi:hypothetical protein
MPVFLLEITAKLGPCSQSKNKIKAVSEEREMRMGENAAEE